MDGNFNSRSITNRTGLSPGQSLVGPLLLALALPVAFTFHDYQPWSWLEAVFIPLVYILALRKSPIWILLLVAIAASLNRETAVALSLIPIALAVRNWNVSDLRRYYLYCSAALIIPWMVIRFYMLTVWPGPANQRAISIQEIWERNFDFSGAASLQWGGVADNDRHACDIRRRNSCRSYCRARATQMPDRCTVDRRLHSTSLLRWLVCIRRVERGASTSPRTYHRSATHSECFCDTGMPETRFTVNTDQSFCERRALTTARSVGRSKNHDARKNHYDR